MNANIFCNKCHRIPAECVCSRALNAYELAKAQQAYSAPTLEEIIKQQADRIERLEAEAKAKNNYLQQHCQKIDEQADRIAELEKLVSQRFDDGKRLGVLETEDKFRTTPQIKELSDEDIEYITKQWFNCRSDTKLTEQFVMPLYSVVNLCKAILKKAAGK